MKLTINWPTSGQVCYVTVTGEASVLFLKKEIEKQIGLNPSKQQLFFGSQVLQPIIEKLAAFNLGEGDTVKVVKLVVLNVHTAINSPTSHMVQISECGYLNFSQIAVPETCDCGTLAKEVQDTFPNVHLERVICWGVDLMLDANKTKTIASLSIVDGCSIIAVEPLVG